VSKVKIKFPQNDWDQCFIGGDASSLYYCGLIEEANRMKNLAHKFEFIPKPVALQELKRVMREFFPCIDDCMAFNLRTKNKKIKHLTIQDLIEIKTRFPTLVIPYGKDGSNNHSFVVVDNLIFDSTDK
jgi:hypothetical protein